MRKLYAILFFLPFLFSTAVAQQATIEGKIINNSSKETLPGVNVILNTTTGVVTDINGNYSIKVNAGKIKLTYKYIGFASKEVTYTVTAGQKLTADVAMTEESMIIEGVVVSAGKFEQKISDVTISMSVLRPEQMENQNTNCVTEALNKIPGVDIMESQPSIRGGSGYSYGAGSRVLVMVDDMPLLSPDAGDAKWNYIPIENVSQIEVLKGASSALFGSSALNGVINVRTAFPTDKPKTKILYNAGIYMNPARKETKWWGQDRPWYEFWKDEQPWFSGLNLFHSRKIGDLDLVVGANGYKDQSFRKTSEELHGRLNVNLRYRPKKVEGLSLGVNTNFMYVGKTDFFLWQNDSTGALMQNPGSINVNQGYRVNVDPYFLYFNKRGSKYSLKTRYFRSTNLFKDNPDKNNIADLYYGDYQYQRFIKNKLNWTAGISGSYTKSTAELFGDHYGVNASFYSQFDAKLWKKLSVSLGIRVEYYRIDTAESVSTYALYVSKDTIKLPIWPVFRAGVNYQLAKYTFIRASFGQGYRFPSIAERFIKTNIGGLNLFPNTALKPETGWSAEIGAKQGFKMGSWNGFLDIAGFWTEYSNMMEFTFGIFKPDTALYPTLNDIGFKSINVGHARITGLDMSFAGQGSIGGFPAYYLIGYTYTNPIDLGDTTGKIENKILKYRYYHSIKGDYEMSFSRFTVGVSFNYTSKMINIDTIFGAELVTGLKSSVILPGINEYRAKHDKGYFVFDLRGSFDITEKMKIGLILKNVLNNEYMTRPGYIEAPRNLAVQYSLTF